MHEFSIATALLDLVAKHTPPGTKLRTVTVEAGPLQGIDPDAMSWAWQSICSGGPCEGSTIEIQQLPWKLHCNSCNKDFAAREFPAKCECGSDATHPIDGGALRLKSLLVDEEEEPQMNTDED